MKISSITCTKPIANPSFDKHQHHIACYASAQNYYKSHSDNPFTISHPLYMHACLAVSLYIHGRACTVLLEACLLTKGERGKIPYSNIFDLANEIKEEKKRVYVDKRKDRQENIHLTKERLELD